MMVITKNLTSIGVSLSYPFFRKNAKGLRLIKLCLIYFQIKKITRQNGNKKIENYGHLLNTNNWRYLKAIDENKITPAVLLNMSKAPDTILSESWNFAQ